VKPTALAKTGALAKSSAPAKLVVTELLQEAQSRCLWLSKALQRITSCHCRFRSCALKKPVPQTFTIKTRLNQTQILHLHERLRIRVHEIFTLQLLENGRLLQALPYQSTRYKHCQNVCPPMLFTLRISGHVLRIISVRLTRFCRPIYLVEGIDCWPKIQVALYRRILRTCRPTLSRISGKMEQRSTELRFRFPQVCTKVNTNPP
jgi:hypothetical protein